MDGPEQFYIDHQDALGIDRGQLYCNGHQSGERMYDIHYGIRYIGYLNIEYILAGGFYRAGQRHDF